MIKVDSQKSDSLFALKTFGGGVVCFVFLGMGIFLTLFRRWEMSTESWGYWFFARVFSETGKFIVFDRSPLYTLYLNAFRWWGYPFSVTTEYIVTSFILGVTLVFFFRKYLGLALSCFAVILWLPYLQSAEPPVQKLALLASCLAVMVRLTATTRFKFALSYSLLGIAYMFRSTYILWILIYAANDFLGFLKTKKFSAVLSFLKPRKADFPIAIVFILYLWFILMRSPHPWNNVWISTPVYFPKGVTEHLSLGSFIHNYNFRFIQWKLGTLKNHDWYFTNQIFFKGANGLISAVSANPKFMMEFFYRNLKDLIPVMASLTDLFRIALRIFQSLFLGGLTVMILTVYAVFQFVKERSLFIFLVGSILSAVITIFVYPKARYMVPLVPVFTIAAGWWGRQVQKTIERLFSSFSADIRIVLPGVKFLIMPIFILMFSTGTSDWLKLAHGFFVIGKREIRVLEDPTASMKASFKSLEPLIQNCNGVLSIEHMFIGAFSKLPFNRVYDVWEIPPFGTFGKSSYNGLKPERIDCVLASTFLSTEIGGGTNFQIRYDNYIKPYISKLKEEGASVHPIEKFGEAIILNSAQERLVK